MKYLQDKGYMVWAAGAEDKIVKKKLKDMGFYCIDIPFSRSPLSIRNMRAYHQLKTLFDAEKFEVVHVHTPVAAFLTRLAFRHSKQGEILYTAHGFHFYKGAPLLNWLIYHSLERIAIRWTDGLITINQEDYERALTMNYRKDAVHYVHGVGVEPIRNSLDSITKSLVKKSLGLSNGAIIISYIAEINKNKNHIFLLKNWKEIKGKVPEATLLIIGEGNLASSIEKYIFDEELKDVHLLGYREDVKTLLAVTDLVSLLSHREGLPKSIMEAMSASLPCIVSNTRGLRDLITHGENGYVVNLGEDGALVESFVKLLIDRDKRIGMGIVGLERVGQYMLENVIQEYIAIYENVLRK